MAFLSCVCCYDEFPQQKNEDHVVSCCNAPLPAHGVFPVLLLGSFIFAVILEIHSMKGNQCHQKIKIDIVVYWKSCN